MKRTSFWRIIIVLIILGLVGAFAYAVIQARSGQSDNSQKQVLTTFTVLADMARNVAGDRIAVESITKPGAEIHGYEPTPSDMARLKGADLVLDNGLGLEVWADKLYQNAPDVPHVTLSDGVKPIPIAEGPYKDKANPHAWMSPVNALVYVDNIASALVSIDPENQQVYEQNAADYKLEITKLDEQLKNGVATLPENDRYLVSCEGAFTYLIRDYDLKELYLWPINADAQGTPQQIKHVIEEVRAHQVPAVFCESTVSDKAQVQVASETGARFGGIFYVDSLSGSDGPVPTYLKLLEYDISTLLAGLKE